MPGVYQVDRQELAALLAGEPAFRVRQVWDGLYRRVQSPLAMTDLPVTLRRQLDAQLHPQLQLRAEQIADEGDTVKWLWSLDDDAQVETVLMRYPDRVTACISSQAGCAMGCRFCATGQAGFGRHLEVGEIVEQVARAIAAARPRRLGNVVLMGMGEPLSNFDRVWPAVLRMVRDFGLSARHVTVSTVGIVPGIRRLASSGVPVNLAVSLHAANDTLRDDLVPMNRRYPLAALIEACADYVEATGRRLSFEWALIDGINDRPADAAELVELARPLGAHVNLIPLNPTPGFLVRGSPPTVVGSFRRRLGEGGVIATVRSTRGTSIDAACGQLAATQVASQRRSQLLARVGKPPLGAGTGPSPVRTGQRGAGGSAGPSLERSGSPGAGGGAGRLSGSDRQVASPANSEEYHRSPTG